jgi:hypothetical protein
MMITRTLGKSKKFLLPQKTVIQVSVRDDKTSMRTNWMLRAGLMSAGLFWLQAASAEDWNVAGEAWWKHVKYLASDQFEGRNVGSPGFDKAAAYVASQFERAGLKPGGANGYFQPVNFEEAALNAAASSLALVRDGKTTKVPVPDEAQLAILQTLPVPSLPPWCLPVTGWSFPKPIMTT